MSMIHIFAAERSADLRRRQSLRSRKHSVLASGCAGNHRHAHIGLGERWRIFTPSPAIATTRPAGAGGERSRAARCGGIVPRQHADA